MKSRINAANEQSLSRRNQVSNGVQRSNQVQRQNADSVSLVSQNTASRTVRRTQSQTMHDTQNPQNRQGVPQRKQVTAETALNDARQNRQTMGTIQNQSVVSSDVRNRNMAVNQADAAGVLTPTQSRRTPSRTSPAPSMPMQRNEKTVQSQNVVRVQVAKKPAQQKPTVRTPASPAIPEKEERSQMLKTRTTDVTPIKQETKKTAPKAEKTGGDEGGNTVVSVVKAIVYIIFVIVVSVFLALCIINIGNDMFSFVKSDEMVEVEIPEYATLDEVTNVLYKNDIIRYPTIFKLYAVAKKSDTDFLAGTYTVNGMMNYETLLDEFKEKPETGTVDITIPEGYTIDEIIDLFVEGYGIGSREGFVDVIQNGDFDYWFIRELEENGINEGRIYRLEGYLFPDTYQFYKASSEYTVINKMLKRFSQIFTKEYRAQCEVMGYTVDEIVTLASLIEKEAEAPSIFFTVSSVFHNRLNAPWNFPKFESDATVAYVLSHEKGERTTVTAADLSMDTPYNTYLYEGFPPGPIANPSASAMLAALSPQTTDYYYFVANKGTTKFSATKAEHDAYIAEIRQEAPAQQTTGDVPEA